MAIASRTPTPHVAEAFMRKLGVRLLLPVSYSCSKPFQCRLASACGFVVLKFAASCISFGPTGGGNAEGTLLEMHYMYCKPLC